MLIGSDVGSTHHDHHHHQQHCLRKDHSAMTTIFTKVNRDSHLIKKSPPPPLTPTNKTHHRQPQPPLIIYAHAPRVIHTKPQEFKALVQALTGCTGNKNTTTTKNDLPSPPAQPLTPHLPPPSKVPMYCDFDEFETKNFVPLTNNNLFSIDDLKHSASMMEDNINISRFSGGGGDGEYFAPPIFDPPTVHQANNTSLPFFTPIYGDQICCTTKNNFNTTTNNSSVGFIGTVSNKINNYHMFYNQNYVAEIGNGSGCYYSDGVSSSLDLSSSPSSVEEAIDELADFS